MTVRRLFSGFRPVKAAEICSPTATGALVSEVCKQQREDRCTLAGTMGKKIIQMCQWLPALPSSDSTVAAAIVWKNIQCFTARTTPWEEKKRRNELMYSVTEDYCSAMSVFSSGGGEKDAASEGRHQTGQMDTQRQGGSACQMSMGKWTVRDSDRMRGDRDSPKSLDRLTHAS